MDEVRFDQLIKGAAARQSPALPPSFTRDVLREIRVRKSGATRGGSWWHDAAALFFRPRWLAGSMAIALAVGVTLPAAMARPNDTRQAMNGLGLSIFSGSSATMPSGLLTKAP